MITRKSYRIDYLAKRCKGKRRKKKKEREREREREREGREEKEDAKMMMEHK